MFSLWSLLSNTGEVKSFTWFWLWTLIEDRSHLHSWLSFHLFLLWMCFCFGSTQEIRVRVIRLVTWMFKRMSQVRMMMMWTGRKVEGHSSFPWLVSFLSSAKALKLKVVWFPWNVVLLYPHYFSEDLTRFIWWRRWTVTVFIILLRSLGIVLDSWHEWQIYIASLYHWQEKCWFSMPFSNVSKSRNTRIMEVLKTV